MTLIAGIVSRRPDLPLPQAVCDTIRKTISRDPRDEIMVFEDKRAYFVQVDIKAFGKPSHKTADDGSLTLFTGEAFLADENQRDSSEDLDSIHDELKSQNFNVLQQADGTFSAVHYEPEIGTIDLITDKLGLRPLYFWIDKDYLIFASALRILEGINEVPKRMDLRAVTQIVGLGYALGERTPYADIYVLRAAEILTVTDSQVLRRKFWRWDGIEPAMASEGALLDELYHRFNGAVARRLGNDKTTAAYLSGGLDSRCIVAALRDKSVRVHTFNFARARTQDQAFASQFANQIGSIHQEIPKKAGDLVPDYSSLMSNSWAATNGNSFFPSEHPAIVWSGEGGSVALGHVHLTEKIVDLMREGRVDEAITEHLERESAQVSLRLFRTEISEQLSSSIHHDIREELKNYDCRDAARNFYLYLLLNDQHRKLANHFENIDLHRLELQLPFFDSSFLELIVSIPIDICLRHKLYIKWLALFQPTVTAVPWQVYPGHEPCPVPIPEEIDYQWSRKYQSAEHAARKQNVMKQASELLHSADFPNEILSKRVLRVASWIHATGLRDYQYLIGPAHTYHEYYHRCGRRYVFEPHEAD